MDEGKVVCKTVQARMEAGLNQTGAVEVERSA